MKNLSIKLFCIFIIIMYCLAPLGAIDLNQDSNKALDDLNDTTNDTSIDIDNDTSPEDPTNIDIDNDTTPETPTNDESIDINDTTPENPTKDKSIDIVNDTTSDINETTLDINDTATDDLKWGDYIKMDMKIDDIVCGQKPVAKVHTDMITWESITCHITGNITFTCSQTGYSRTMDVKNSWFTIEETCEYELSDLKLQPGVYKVGARYNGDSDFGPQATNTWFKVRGNVDPNLNVQIDDITQGENPKIKITANEAMNENIQVKIKDVGTYKVKVKNGVGERTVHKKLAPGNYTVTATNEEGCDFKKEVKTVNFTVKEDSRTRPYLNVHVDNILEAEKAKVSIHANESFNSPVKLNIMKVNDSKKSTVNVANGIGETSLDNLAPGSYAAIVTFDGNDQFKAVSNSTTFNVSPRDDPDLSIAVENNTPAGKTDIKVGGNPNLAKPVTIKLNNSQEHSVKLENGQGTLTIDLASGEYTATVSYDGDNDYKPGEKSVQFTKKGDKDPKFKIQINETLPGQKPIAEIYCNETINDKVDISCPQFHQGYEAQIKNGHAKVTLDGEDDLAEGTYTVNLKYDGDYTFKPIETSTSFKVAKQKSNLSMEIGTGGYSGTTAMVFLKSNKLLNDNVKVEIDNGYYHDEDTVKFVDGIGEADFGGLDPGTYKVKATFEGNKILEPGSASGDVTIQRHF